MTEHLIDTRHYPVVGAHLSGRWDRSPRLLKRQLRRAAKGGATWLSLTEVADGKRPAAVALPGWTKTQDVDGPGGKRFDRGECAFLTRDDTWEVLRWRSYVIGPDLGPGNRVVMLMALLRHRLTGATSLMSVCHTPSAVEANWRGQRAGHYRQMVDRWRRIHATWVRAFKPDNEAVVADWNINLHAAWALIYLEDAFPTLDPPAVLPKGGTHGPRLIDMILTRGWRKVRLVIRSSRGASDHRELWVYGWITYVRRK